MHTDKINISIFYQGKTVDGEFPTDRDMHSIIAEVLHDKFRVQDQDPNDYFLKYNATPLSGHETLAQADVPDGATLFLSRVDGGGGANSPTVPILDECIARAKFDAETQLYRERQEIFLRRGWDIREVCFPSIKVVYNDLIGVIVNCRNYDHYPPSVSFADPTSWQPLTQPEIQRRTGKPTRNILDNHPETHLTFVCMQGFWEYHTHPSHVNDSWSSHKASMGIDYCLEKSFTAIFG